MEAAKVKTTLMYTGIIAAIVLFIIFLYQCPIYALTGIQCPGCGITRAYISAIQLDFRTAFSHHPLFLTIAPLLFYITFRNKLKKTLSGKVETIILLGITTVFITVYIIRMLSNSFVV